MPIKLYVRCNPLLDITSTVDEAFLVAHHLEPDSEYVYDDRFKGLIQAMEQRPDTTLTAGGSGLHTARVARWILQKKASQSDAKDKQPSVAYIGCVGDDAHGAALQSAAEADGVTVLLEKAKDAPTGVCAVCKLNDPHCTRTLVANLGAANSLTSAFLNSTPVVAARFEAPIVYTTAYATPFHAEQTVRLSTDTRADRSGGEGGAVKQLFAVGLSSKNILEAFGEDLVDVLERMDIIIGNRAEMRDLAMMLQWVPTEMSDEELVRKLATEMMYDGHAVRRVVMTRGAQSVLFATSDGTHGEASPADLVHGSTPVKKCKRTGAGDAFTGGLLASLLENPSDLKRACDVGNAAAAYVIRHSIQLLPAADAPVI